MSEEQGGAASFRVTFKGQGQSDPWLTVEGTSAEDLAEKLGETDMDLLSIVAGVAANHVAALNAQPGISKQRDNATTNTARAAAPTKTPTYGERPALSTGLKPEKDGNIWINLPWVKSAAQRDKMKQFAKDLGVRYKPEEATQAGVPMNSKGTGPERPWCVHLSYMDEESVAAILQAVETDFKDI